MKFAPVRTVNGLPGSRPKNKTGPLMVRQDRERIGRHALESRFCCGVALCPGPYVLPSRSCWRMQQTRDVARRNQVPRPDHPQTRRRHALGPDGVRPSDASGRTRRPGRVRAHRHAAGDQSPRRAGFRPLTQGKALGPPQTRARSMKQEAVGGRSVGAIGATSWRRASQQAGVADQ